MSENFLLMPWPSVCIPGDAEQRDERDQQRVLNQILSFIFANEPNEQFLHVPSPFSLT